ncbi:putative nadp-dependent alcohol dehydrogenase [Phaeomoniella chlamydospora]|uniref:Putative nadp-dependent alcohol dehydrogenase n=1 Tax=Phaeomoniella chlamydospora TaxID=158046 RepID=A0A0G2EUW8_PHACM|nr:putative nadp-dependent alcohol dehydrogenase [Phaeomoniella chlamydospora]
MVEFTVFKGSKEGKLVKSTVSKELGAKEVLIQVTHSGLCGTDLHFKHADMALGHEGVGVVTEVGKDVTLVKTGERVGWGYEHSCCGHCKQCYTGFETLCPERAMYGYADLDQGSMATAAVWKEDFLFKIPDGLSSAEAAPLQCGGATVYNALVQGNAKATDKVGIIGIGGLGHLAIQYAAKMGCEVHVFSSTDSKRDEALALGATKFYATKGASDLSAELGVPQIDHLLVCSSFQPNWAQYLAIMAPRGTIYPLSVSDQDLKMPYMPLIASALKVQGILVASKQVHRDMLEFSARHGVKPILMEFPMTLEGAEKAFATLDKGDMRYRGVLVNES